MKDNYFNFYFENIKNLINEIPKNYLYDVINSIKKLKNKNKIFVFGNGGSSSIADHFFTDMVKNTDYKIVNFNHTGIVTCFSNDYGYEKWVHKSILKYGQKGDLIILISASGESRNIINAAKVSKKIGFSNIITLTGFNKKNSVSKLGSINIWVNSRNYNCIENIHQIFLLSIIDYLSKKKF